MQQQPCGQIFQAMDAKETPVGVSPNNSVLIPRMQKANDNGMPTIEQMNIIP